MPEPYVPEWQLRREALKREREEDKKCFHECPCCSVEYFHLTDPAGPIDEYRRPCDTCVKERPDLVENWRRRNSKRLQAIALEVNTDAISYE